ncbi:MAG: SUMF1/EgtB/PvdO family nonheme iron enzyme [Phycisphaerales bacterium]|nr:SUMF1/EgtB/PvdO family nonheme iron enzyme [Phycisphaerales bacterium]
MVRFRRKHEWRSDCVQWVRGGCAAVAAVGLFAGAARADIDPLSGVDFVTITHAGNAPWMGDGTPDDFARGRGSVGYEYRIGRLEVTSQQWTEFFNAALDRPANDRIPHVIAPTFWGGIETTPMNGGRRWRVTPDTALLPTGNITWRTAAIYTNWLCNGKALNREAFLSGAYEVSSFGANGNIFTDQLARTPGAPYFLPTWDEWLKATHFDPNRFGEGQPGWWTGPQGGNFIPAGGPPGTGNANWRDFPGWQNVPLGAYTRSSPWGLKDTSGATAEWTESYVEDRITGVRDRLHDGSYWGSNSSGVGDLIYYPGGDYPAIPFYQYGFRLAASVPSPSMCIPVMAAVLWLARSRKCPFRRIAAKGSSVVNPH